MSKVSVLWHWTFLSYSYMKTLFLHNIFLWILKFLSGVFMCVWVRERISVIRGEYVHVCTYILLLRCMSVTYFKVTLLVGGIIFALSQVCGSIKFGIIKLRQTLTKCYISSLSVSLSIIQRKILFSWIVSCIDVTSPHREILLCFSSVRPLIICVHSLDNMNYF